MGSKITLTFSPNILRILVLAFLVLSLLVYYRSSQPSEELFNTPEPLTSVSSGVDFQESFLLPKFAVDALDDCVLGNANMPVNCYDPIDIVSVFVDYGRSEGEVVFNINLSAAPPTKEDLTTDWETYEYVLYAGSPNNWDLVLFAGVTNRTGLSAHCNSDSKSCNTSSINVSVSDNTLTLRAHFNYTGESLRIKSFYRPPTESEDAILDQLIIP